MSDQVIDKPTNGTPTKSKKTGCATLVVLAIVLFVIIGLIGDCMGPSVKINGDSGTMEHILLSTATAKLEGYRIAQEVYNAATKHAELKTITVNCKVRVGGGAVDKYGKSVENPVAMGAITINDLDEVRKYKDDGAYAYENQGYYEGRVLGLDNSNLLDK